MKELWEYLKINSRSTVLRPGRKTWILAGKVKTLPSAVEPFLYGSVSPNIP